MDIQKGGISKVNNFDIIRLFAALEVVLFHSLEHLKIDYVNSIAYPLLKFIRFFPGVPVFFTISGYLIYSSFKKRPDKLKLYFKNRFLRLYPALWFCLLLTIVLLFSFKTITIKELYSKPILDVWIVCQATFFQFYTPDILRGWGVGTPNGSLWTLCVEIQYYILVPLVFLIVSKARKLKLIFLLVFIAVSVLSSFYFKHWDVHSVKYKLSEVFILPYLYNFLLGILAAEYWEPIKKFINGKFLFWIALYVIWILVFGFYFKSYIPAYWPANIQSFLGIVLLSGVTLSAAYSAVNLSSKILRGTDMSYGVYIYHMLIVNTLVALGYFHNPLLLFVVFLTTIIVSYLSWIFIEHRALKLKQSYTYEANRPEY